MNSSQMLVFTFHFWENVNDAGLLYRIKWDNAFDNDDDDDDDNKFINKTYTYRKHTQSTHTHTTISICIVALINITFNI